MDNTDFTEQQKQKLLFAATKFFDIYGNYEVSDYTYMQVALCFWNYDGFQIPDDYIADQEEPITLRNDFESKYRLLKAVIKTMSGERKPYGYGVILTYYVSFFYSLINKIDFMRDGIAVALKYVISPSFAQDEEIKNYIYQDFHGLGHGIVHVDSIRIHPLWTTSSFYEEILFEDELDLLEKA
ncbi:TPA: hypothetical protein PX805_001010 [Vibrio cholerae]|uniref:Uncharacterized protein n=1 Tax=Vibrio vulnificus TaxID=672 RepID=A0AAW4HD66_VIBVL|nr:hypothetical protein [Vibrio vulnificus]MBN8123184.1 hypothetical protein [Vibrio vulnificus]HDI3145469.1 hypothetical protein [Vibrio cholerae]HDL9433474.1 hypothetical protein [Vibrio cholerae]